MITRRLFIGTLAGATLAAPLAASAQSPGKVARVGLLDPGHEGVVGADANATTTLNVLRQSLRDLGWIDGKTVIFEPRYARNEASKLPALAAELVRIPVDVVVTVATPATQAAKNATTAIPIVMCPVGDPVAAGFVASLARPGGNITGVSLNNLDVSAKRLQLLKEAVPKMRRVAMLVNEANPGFTKLQVTATLTAATQLGVRLEIVGVREVREFEGAITKLKQTDALIIQPDPLFIAEAGRLAGLALRRRLPATMDAKIFAQVGGLMASAPDYVELIRRAASQVDKLLRGAKPSELPVEQTNRYDLTINVKTAKALGLTIPQSLLLRADEVIQ
ncbi:MAG: ABC transporter substrate-binding protein [bacterium]